MGGLSVAEMIARDQERWPALRELTQSLPDLSDVCVWPSKGPSFDQQREEYIAHIEREQAKQRQRKADELARKERQKLERLLRTKQQMLARLQQQAALAEQKAARASVDAFTAVVRQPGAIDPTQLAEIAAKVKNLEALTQRASQAPRARSEDTAALEARIAELEQRRGFEYRGTWDPAAPYAPGDFVTSNGSMWAARIESHGVRPGDGVAGWQLCVKKGRDAR